jgi:hypothetical protein
MPHLHLNLYNAHGDSPDPEGAEFADLPAARRAAMEGIRSLLSAEVMEGELNLNGHLQIAQDDGTILEDITFSEALKIVGPGRNRS